MVLFLCLDSWYILDAHSHKIYTLAAIPVGSQVSLIQLKVRTPSNSLSVWEWMICTVVFKGHCLKVNVQISTDPLLDPTREGPDCQQSLPHWNSGGATIKLLSPDHSNLSPGANLVSKSAPQVQEMCCWMVDKFEGYLNVNCHYLVWHLFYNTCLLWA